MFATMERITPAEYISNIITENNIDKSINILTETIEQEILDSTNQREATETYIEWLYHLFCSASCECINKTKRINQLEANMAFCKNQIRKYEKSLCSASGDDESDSEWLVELKEKNMRIDLLKEQLFAYNREGRAEHDIIEEIEDFHLAFYLDSLMTQVLEVEQEFSYLKDIEKSMKDHAKSSRGAASSGGIEEAMKDHAGNSEVLKNEGKKNRKNDKAMNKKKRKNDKAMNKKKEKNLTGWRKFLECLITSVLNVDFPEKYWLNRFTAQRNRNARLFDIKRILISMNDTNDEEKILDLLETLATMTCRYINTLQMQFYSAYSENTVAENEQILSILERQLTIFEETIPGFPMVYQLKKILDKRICRVKELNYQYTKLTEKSDKCTQERVCIQDQMAALSENLTKYKAEIEAVLEKCEESVRKHENEFKTIMADKHTDTLDAEEKECSIKAEEEEEQAEQEDQKKERSDEKKMSDETKVQHLKEEDQTNANDQKEDKNVEKIENNAWKIKYEVLKLKDENQWLKMRFNKEKGMLNELMQHGDIDKMIATHKAKISNAETQAELELNRFLNDKLLLYHNIEEASHLQKAIRHRDKEYNRLKEKIAEDTCVKNQNDNLRLKCYICKTTNDNLQYATDVICKISREIITTSSMLRVFPFKKFFEVILEYIVTKEITERNKRKRQERRAKRTKRAKQAGTLETNATEELSNLIDNMQSLATSIKEYFSSENSFDNVGNLTETINSLTIQDENDVDELDEN